MLELTLTNKLENKPGRIVWKKSYYDHVIRSENKYIEKLNYINNNPLKWKLDIYHNTPSEYP